MSGKKGKQSPAAAVEKLIADADKKDLDKGTTVKEKEAVAAVVETATAKAAPAPVVEQKKEIIPDAVVTTAVEKIIPKAIPKKEELVVSDEIEFTTPIVTAKKVKDNLLIVDDQVVELKPLGQLIGLLGFVSSPIDNIDLSAAKHVILQDVLFVFNRGSSVTISDVSITDKSVRHAKSGDFSVGSLPIVVLDDSKLISTYWPSIAGKNKIIGSSITGSSDMFSDIRLEDTNIVESSIKAGSVSLTRANVKSSHISAGAHLSISASWLQSLTVNTKGKCNIREFNMQKPMNMYGYTGIEIEPNHAIYEPDLRFSSLYGHTAEKPVVLNVVSRVDYGHFNAIKPLEFTRCNTSDIVVAGRYIDSDEFEQLYKRYLSDLGQHPQGGYFQGNLGASVSCECLSEEKYLKLVRVIYTLAMGKHDDTYKPDRTNTLENGIIMNLLEQIRSRMNLYKQVNAVVN